MSISTMFGSEAQTVGRKGPGFGRAPGESLGSSNRGLLLITNQIIEMEMKTVS